ncbi:LOW QUALITY PROTEIN: disease resistance protein RPP2B-like [Pistacia vera]|uniref:LOW QUALITY PROTEIN: disease resistance protein RPP2B-like n=1 Tax=Pistacia vera TaxID=55513 RepID=UPI001263828C|nr:LOW QUALITY PROTEIN: disease resistance protein RPP2B-like [Pistacia vera]
MAASSFTVSSTNLQAKHHVFLSFRGADTRYNFTSHLREALSRKSIPTFIDNKPQRGDEISPSLLNAIEGSKILVIVFSKDYASSRWCLEELVKILECKNMHGGIVIPVFYHVDPSDVRNRTGSFGDGFIELEERFNEQPEMVQRWRSALSEVANLSGWPLNDKTSEAEIVKDLVDDILRRLRNVMSPSDNKNLVGVESTIKELIELLLNKDVCTLGIWGIGGIGKTTIARAVFNEISNCFEGFYFAENVRKNQKILMDYLASGSRVIITTRNKQVLESCKVDRIYEVKKLSHPEDMHLFSRYAFKQNLIPEDYLQLSNKVVNYAKGIPLALKVLGSSLVNKSVEVWESTISKLEETPPLNIYKVLKVSYDGLDGEEQDIFLDIACFFKWKDQDLVIKILKASDLKAECGISVLVDKCLVTISLDNMITMHDLLQEMGRTIVREEKDIGKRSRLWHPKDTHHGTEAIRGICMDMFEIRDVHLNPLTFSNMHSLKFLNVYGAVHNKVHGFQGLEFDFPELRYICWHNYRWKSLPCNFKPKNLVALETRYSNLEELWSSVQVLVNLKYIDLSYSVHLRKIADLSQAPNLESLILEGCTSLIEISSPSTRKLNKLVILNLRNCKSLPGLPPGIHQSNSLRFVILSGCSNLKTAPKISCNTEQLSLDGTAIKEFSSTNEPPSRLVQFSLQNCSRLERLPRNFHKFESLKYLSLSSCSNLESIPKIPRKIEELYIDGIAIEELPSSIGSLSNLQTLSLRNCSRLKSLPDGICKLKSLKYLSLSGCSNIKTIPKISCKMEQLHLDETAIKELPSLIEYLSSLVTLSIKNCSSLENLPDEICNLKSLKHLYISGCSKLDRLPEDIGNLQSLEVFEANGIAATKLPSSMESLSNIRELSFERWKGQELVRSLSPMLSGLKLFKKLNLNDCNITELPNSLGDLSFLEHLYLSGNNFESIPATIINLSKLDLSHCKMLQSLPNLPGDIQLLVADSCKSLQTLSDLPIPSHGYFNGNLSFINCFNLDWRTLTKILDYAHKNSGLRSVKYDYKARTLHINCELLLKCEDGLKKMGSGSFLAWNKEYAPSHVEFDHVFLGYDCQVNDKPEWDEFPEAIIKFSVTDEECVVKKCGVRLLFSQEESMNESSLCLLSDEDEDEEDEPQSKRL